MLSPETIATLHRLREQQATYTQADENRRELGAKTIIAFVGATCEGKNTVMDELAQLDPNYHLIGTITSRPPRDSDIKELYTYYDHTDEGLQPLFAAIAQRRLVQYFVTPRDPFYVYGTAVRDYTATYNIGDYFARSVADLRTRGFKRVIAATIIAPPDQWLTRLNERFPLQHPERASRITEAIESFEWSLAQTADHLWVMNQDGQARAAAQTVVAAMPNERSPDETGRHYAEQSITLAQSLLA